MMKTTIQSPRCARVSSSILRYSTVFLLGAALVAAQSRITKPPAQTNSNSSVKHPHVATLHSSDSSEGSRVALSSNQSLNDYEAYRRGDRFYVKIPAADVSRAETIRGRGFADVKAQRSGDSTVVSFRLQPGATARVEQRSNRLDVVFTVAGGSSSIASNPTREVPRINKSADSNRNSNANRANVSPSTANKNSANRSTAENSRNGNANIASKTRPAPALASNSASKPIATPLPSPQPSPSAKTPAQTPTPKMPVSALASPTTQPTPGSPINQSHQDRWSRMKERINYWILLAQLNPLPVAIGVGVILFLLGLFLFQRRRARSPKRVRSSLAKSTRSTTTKNAAASVQPAPEPKPASEVAPAIAEAAAVIAAASPSAAASAEVAAADAEQLRTEDSRRGRIAQVTEEARKLTSGAAYDESIIGSDDRETRQLVGAELLSAIVGRSEPRREHARAAFMKHGYFDDATRDLRIADSANERAAAARRLSFVNDREATPHLVAALDDPSPDVRRTAVEALMDLRDPSAIGPLNSLMQTENDRKVPRTVIRQAIEACATVTPDEVTAVATPSGAPAVSADSSSQSIQTEREVIEL
jgi:HEAT repeats